ncbi:MAG: hypothetical protein ACE5H2_01475 [Terriglobia bacterium]
MSPERKRSLRRRIEPLLAAFDPKLHLIELLLDSTKQHLGIVVQKDEQPILLRLDWLRYVSMSDSELRDTFFTQLHAKKLRPSR